MNTFGPQFYRNLQTHLTNAFCSYPLQLAFNDLPDPWVIDDQKGEAKAQSSPKPSVGGGVVGGSESPLPVNPSLLPPPATKTVKPLEFTVDEDEEPRQGASGDHREDNLGDYLQRQAANARKPFEPFEEILNRVKAREFPTQRAMTEQLNKPSRWVLRFKRVAILQRYITEAEWKASFTHRKKKRKGTTR